MSYESFWLRYFYKVQLLQQVCSGVSALRTKRGTCYMVVSRSLQEEERRAELMARAKRKEEQWQWDEDTEEGKDDTSWSGLLVKGSFVPQPSCLQH